MERILFGDNQFFGINHMSEGKARSQAIKFQSDEAVMEVLDDAYSEGICAFMCTTHERIRHICEIVQINRIKYSKFVIYPCMPYAHKYADAVTELGLVGALKQFTNEDRTFSTLLRGGVAVARKDVATLIKILVDAEMKMFSGLSTPVVFLQNVITDLLLGMGFDDALAIFSEYVRHRYDAEPGFITMNLPKLLDALDRVGITNPVVCSNINKIGFRMCGGIAKYEEVIANRIFQPVAMSIFASGAIPPHEAIEYVCKQPRIASIVFGASNRRNIHETVSMINSMSISNDRPLT